MYGLPQNSPKIPMAYSIGATKRSVGKIPYLVSPKAIEGH
ncbi:MAG: class I SAM-dependent methyltransferase, partial [Mesorhizobium sp.]